MNGYLLFSIKLIKKPYLSLFLLFILTMKEYQYGTSLKNYYSILFMADLWDRYYGFQFGSNNWDA